ncbi:MAG: extensin family protein [Myxococcota bacterium]
MSSRLPALLAALALAGSLRASAQPSLAARLDALEAAAVDARAVGRVDAVRYLLATAERIAREHPDAAVSWRARALRYARALEGGADPFAAEGGAIVPRGYRSRLSDRLQGYAVYLPPGYDPSRRYPLYVALHGGSSNGLLFLGVVLGNNLDWESYDAHLYDEFTPRWTPDWIVVAPTGFGQVMWRWMGERDVLDVIADVQAHYAVDADRVVLGGLSNGGVGAYSIGTRHAWRFSAVQAMAGAPSWLQYLGRARPVERRSALRLSGLHLAESTFNTRFAYFHGRRDGGPMRPRYVEEYTAARARIPGLAAAGTWFDAGHDILYLVHRHGRVYPRLAELRRDASPREVRVVTADYRAARQHWLEVTRIRDYPRRARLLGRVGDDGGTVTLTTEGVDAFELRLADAPLVAGDVRLSVDGDTLYEGPRAPLGDVLSIVRRGPERDGPFAIAALEDRVREKRRGLSGPIDDAYFGPMVHVYGTANADHTAALRRAAERGAKGWPLWAWDLRQPVLADAEVDEAVMRSATLVLYGSPGDNGILERIAGALPLRVDAEGVHLGDAVYADAATRFIAPNPLAPQRYVIVQAGSTPELVRRANRLPEFLGDYVVMDAAGLAGPQGRTAGRRQPRAAGFFDDRWRLPGVSPTVSGHGAGPEQGAASGPSPAAGDGAEFDEAPSLPIPPAPPVPPAPARYVPGPAGQAERALLARIARAPNFRAEIAGARWRVDRRVAWRVQPTADCHAALREAGVPFRPRPAPPSAEVPSPVEILGPVGGVWFRMSHDAQPFVLSCAMAARLPDLARIAARLGVHGVEVLSAYRDTPPTSFHTGGLALDLSRFWTAEGWLDVATHFDATPSHRTCEDPRPTMRRARLLRALACGLWRSRRFSTVLTPNYNEGHRDHLHLDARPADPRLYLR